MKPEVCIHFYTLGASSHLHPSHEAQLNKLRNNAILATRLHLNTFLDLYCKHILSHYSCI